MSICNVTKLPCAYCNPICEHRIENNNCDGCMHWWVRLYDSKMCCYNPDSEYYHDAYDSGCNLHTKRKDDYMEEKKYVCGFCGKEYETVAGRMNCETVCARVEKEKAEKERREKLSREKEDREQKIIQSRKELLKLEQSYYKDYGEYVYVLREPVKSTADFNEDWNRYFEDVFHKFLW